MERRELVSPRTRRAFREYLVGWPLGAIQDLFENEGLQLGQGSPAVTGQRRSLVERYYTTVDWTSPQEVRRVLRAYEHVLADADLPPPIYGELKRHLEWDGYAMDATGRLRSPPAGSLAELPVTSLDDPAAIYEHIDRIGRVMDTDLAQAISGAWRWRSSSAGRWFTASEGRRATSLARRAAPQPRPVATWHADASLRAVEVGQRPGRVRSRPRYGRSARLHVRSTSTSSGAY